MARRARSKRHKLPVEPVTLQIQRLSHDGRGIANLSGKVAFVSGALPNETVTAGYTNSRAQFDELDVLTVEQPSPDRVTPQCKVFHVCGGCSLQHFSSPAQIEYKRNTLFEILAHATKHPLPESARLPSVTADNYHYRRKARLAVRYVAKKGGTLVGFREKHGSFITETDECPVLVEPASALIQPLRKLIDQLDARLQIPQIEVAAGETQQG
ncbi:MAG: 23S rRNA (uracil(1939)-C(5))-methyltransferase, partial [Pseudohongiellaceae bacterium]